MENLLWVVSCERAKSRLVELAFGKAAVSGPDMSLVTPHVNHRIHISPFFPTRFFLGHRGSAREEEEEADEGARGRRQMGAKRSIGVAELGAAVLPISVATSIGMPLTWACAQGKLVYAIAAGKPEKGRRPEAEEGGNRGVPE